MVAAAEDGLSLVELLVAALVTSLTLGAAFGLLMAVQRTFAYELEDAAVQHDARFALLRIADTLAAGGANPYDIGGAVDAAAGCSDAMPGVEVDPNQDGIADDVRVVSDVTRPDGLVGGTAAACDTGGEDVTFAFDASSRAVTRLDAALDDAPSALTDAVVTGLAFAWLDEGRLRVTLSVRSPSRHAYTGEFTTYTHVADVRIRGAAWPSSPSR